MNTILVNVVPEETRVAIIDSETHELTSVEYERTSTAHLVGNIYKGRVQNVLPGMQAAFVDIGMEKNAFLYIGDGLPYGGGQVKDLPRQKIHVGESLPVQIIKDATGKKGPRATMHISLPGRALVLMPTAAYTGISRRIESEAERARLKEIAERIAPPGMGLIVRTAAEGKSEAELKKEADGLHRIWQGVLARFKLKSGRRAALLYRDADLLVRTVRDMLEADTKELIIDDHAAFQRVKELAEAIAVEFAGRVTFFDERKSLFEEYGVESELESLGARRVELKSGGFLVIDKTEALTVIDVNTGSFVGRSNLADTVYSANIEAATEIMKQIRLRDIGGIIVVDFIDMEKDEQKESLLSYLRQLSHKDRTKMSVVDITSLGLVEITRKKSRTNIESLVYAPCPTCKGRGRVESPETVSVRISRDIRRLEKKRHAPDGYEIEVHESVADELGANQLLMNLAAEFAFDLKVVSRPDLHPESYTIMQRVEED